MNIDWSHILFDFIDNSRIKMTSSWLSVTTLVYHLSIGVFIGATTSECRIRSAYTIDVSMDWRNYDQDTQKYENESNKLFIKNFVVPHLRPGCTVLDIGCGPGATTHNSLLPELPADATLHGIDANSFLINTAKKKYEKSGITFLHLDALDIGTLETDFDMIVSMFCSHLIRDQKRFWKEMASKLKDGGVIVIHAQGKNVFSDSVISLSKTEQYAEVLREAKSRYAEYIYLEKEEDSRKMLENQIKEALPDFEVNFSVTNQAIQYDTKQEFYLNLQGDNHFRNRMDDALAEVYVNDLMDKIQKLQGLEKDDFQMTMTMYEITVKKILI